MAKGLSDNINGQLNEEKLYLRTNVDGYFFDGFINVSQTHTLTVTSHPVQSGANIADHAYKEPVQINAKIIVSDAFTSDDSTRTREARYFLANGSTKSMGAFNVLKQLQLQRKLLKIVTPYGSYSNMLLTSLNADYTYKNIYNMIADCTFEEVIIANEKTVKVSSRAQTTDKSSPTPDTKSYNEQQEQAAYEATGKALDEAANRSSKSSGTTVKNPDTVITKNYSQNNAGVIYSGTQLALKDSVKGIKSNIGTTEAKLTTASGGEILAVHATKKGSAKGTYYSVALE